MRGTSWNSLVVKKTEELSQYAWESGYFQSSHENWDRKTWIRNFHELRLRDLALFMLGDLRNRRILDIGCGAGAYILTMLKMGAEVAGQDLSQEAVRKASERINSLGYHADLKAGDATKLQFDDNTFDSVFSSDFFEHISFEQKQKVVAEAHRVLKPGGIFVIKTPNLDYLKMSVRWRRLTAALRFKSPLDIHIAHTRNNPDCEHHGLTTFKELETLLENNMFHSPQVVLAPLGDKRLPRFLAKFLHGHRFFSEAILLSARKPIFASLYD